MLRIRHMVCLLTLLLVSCVISLAQHQMPPDNSLHQPASDSSSSGGDQRDASEPDQPEQQQRPDSIFAVYVGKDQYVHMLKGEKVQVADSYAKTNVLSGFAQSHLVSPLLQSGLSSFQSNQMMHHNSFMGQTLVGSASTNLNDVMGMLFTQRKANNTDVWALRGRSGSVVVPNDPTFEVHYDEITGVNPDEYQPVILKLTITPDNRRRVGEMHMKSDKSQHGPVNSEISSFAETRVPAQVTLKGRGNARITASNLQPGEYALALRPVSEHMKLPGVDAQNGDGSLMVLMQVWAFEVE